MFKVLVKTKDWIDEFAQKELKGLFDLDFKVLDEGFYEFCFEDEKGIFDFVLQLVYYSRVIESVYLKVGEFDNLKDLKVDENLFGFLKKEFLFEVDCEKGYEFDRRESEKKIGDLIRKSSDFLKVDLDSFDLSFKLFSCGGLSYVGLDLVGFLLSKRDYRLNVNSSSINSLVLNYCFYLLGLDELDSDTGFSIIDPCASLGDVIIEASLFNPRVLIHVKDRYSLPVSRLFGLVPKMPKKCVSKSKFVGVVQNNKVFKQLRENINFSGQKIKISQYELDWLDVKFGEGDIDYVVCQLPSFKSGVEFDEFLKEFFYQAEFVCKEKICVISKRKVVAKHLKKNGLKIEFEKSVLIGEQKYFVYVVC